MKNFLDKNLLIICPSFPGQDDRFHGGIFVKEYVNSIKGIFHKVFVISPIPFGFFFTNKEKLCSEYSYDNVEVYYPKFFHVPISYFRKEIGNTHFGVTNNIIKKYNIHFDLIHAHFAWPSGYVGVALKQKYDKKLLVTVHENMKKLQDRDILKNVDFLTCVNNDVVNIFPENNTTYIPNGYNLDNFNLNKEGISQDKKYIVSIGNLNINKNHIVLIKAVAHLISQGIQIHCYIIGDGPLKQYLQDYIEVNKLSGNIELIGAVKNESLHKYLITADLSVLPSIQESFGIVQIESMGCGTPVIATKNGGSEEIISSEELGFLLQDYNDHIGLASLIKKGLIKKWDREKIMNHAQEKYSYRCIRQEYIKIFYLLLNK